MCSRGDCCRYRVPIPSLTSILHLKSQREEAGLGGRCEATKQKSAALLLQPIHDPLKAQGPVKAEAALKGAAYSLHQSSCQEHSFKRLWALCRPAMGTL